MPVYKTKTEKTKDNKIWYFKCNYRDMDGNIKQKKSKKFATKEEATKEEAKFLLNGGTILKSNITIYDVYNEYFFLDDSILNRESSLYTKESRARLYILPFFKNNSNNYDSISTINAERIKKWKNWLNNTDAEIRKYDVGGKKVRKKLSTQTKKSIFNTFSSLMLYAVEKHNLEYNPMRLVENFKDNSSKIIEQEKIRYITNEEYKMFINEVNDYEYKVMFHFLYEVGCRKGEMASLTWNNIDFKKEQIKLNTTFSRDKNGKLIITATKNKKIKYIDISNNLKKELLNIYNKAKQLDGFTEKWFIFGGIRKISYSTLNRKKDEAFKRLEEKGIEITRITIHEFRHSSASYMISNNVPIEVIAYRLGDSVETIRKVYAHLFPDTQKLAKGLFENL